ncbi:MAG: SDR family oxidoreductase [Bacteroidales bacterium]|nr:SDR family oxidoreductase [Bacteroidales bacterium]MCF8389863.1 SDR family oxidoreductase [Bacteroidales bacterium]
MGTGLLKAGVWVILADIREENARANAKAISDSVGNASVIPMNVSDPASIEKACNEILKTHSKIDILINAAGGNMPGATINPDQEFFDLKIEEMDKVTDLNFKGTVLPSMVVGKIMAKQKSGSIINISSMAAMPSITRVVGYSAAKAAVSNFTQWMAMEMGRKYGNKIRVNALATGFFIGDQNRALLTNEDGSYTERGNLVIQNTPMGRFGEAEELIGAVLFLSSKSASFVTGVILPVDGGFSFFRGV